MKPLRYIHRSLEKELKKAAKHFPAIVITGPRQTGKSTLLKKMFPKAAVLSFDDPALVEEAVKDPRLFLEKYPEPLILDEIQYVPELLSYLKLFIDEDRQRYGRFYLTGSAQFPLMKNLSDSLAGRIAILELTPFSLEEKRKALRKTQKTFDLEDAYIHACLQGSYPELVLQKDIDPQQWYGSYVRTYLERDVRNLINVGDLRDFQRFLTLLANHCSHLLNLSSLASDIGISVHTAKHWLSVLEASRIIYLLYPYYQSHKKRIIRQPKIYFLDCGLLCHLLSIQHKTFLFKGPLAGALFENFCVQETVKILFEKSSLHPLYYLRTSNGLEVDLLIEKDGVLYPIELKLSKTPRMTMAKPIELFKKLFYEWHVGEGRIISLHEDSYPLTKEVSLQKFDDYLHWLNQS